MKNQVNPIDITVIWTDPVQTRERALLLHMSEKLWHTVWSVLWVSWKKESQLTHYTHWKSQIPYPQNRCLSPYSLQTSKCIMGLLITDIAVQCIVELLSTWVIHHHASRYKIPASPSSAPYCDKGMTSLGPKKIHIVLFGICRPVSSHHTHNIFRPYTVHSSTYSIDFFLCGKISLSQGSFTVAHFHLTDLRFDPELRCLGGVSLCRLLVRILQFPPNLPKACWLRWMSHSFEHTWTFLKRQLKQAFCTNNCIFYMEKDLDNGGCWTRFNLKVKQCNLALLDKSTHILPIITIALAWDTRAILEPQYSVVWALDRGRGWNEYWLRHSFMMGSLSHTDVTSFIRHLDGSKSICSLPSCHVFDLEKACHFW